MRVNSLCQGLFVLFLLSEVCFCSGDDKTIVEVVGNGDCADCKENNLRAAEAFSGLHVTIDCKLKNGDMKRIGEGELDKEGKFKISLPKETVENGKKLKEECYAQLHSAAAIACPVHNGLEASKIVLKSQTNEKITFGPTKDLQFSTALCTSKFLWPFHKPYHPWKKHIPFPPLKNFGHPWLLPPLPPKPLPPPIPIYKPPIVKPHPPLVPIHKPPKPPCPPIHKPPKPPCPPPVVPIHKPPKPPCPPVPIYKPKPKPPIYKPPVVKPLPPPVPIYKPKPKPPIYKPPVVKPLPPPVPIYKPKPPIYKPPVIVKPLPPPVPIYKPKPPIYKPPVIVKPLPPPVPIYKPPVITKPLPPPIPLHPLPPFHKKPHPPLPKLPPLPKFPPKYFHHPKFGYFPPHPPSLPHA